MENRIEKARPFINQYYQENELEGANNRIKEVEHALQTNSFYKHTEEELRYGSKLAWRNSNRCIGRLFWKSLKVFDHRELLNEEAIFNALLQHIKYTTNKGNIRSCVSIFHPDRVRIHNEQLIRYAGYQMDSGSVIGDPASIEFTNFCIKHGWKPKYGNFDILPLVIQLDSKPPIIFKIPSNYVLEVKLEHPLHSWFKDLSLKWYAVPIISNMALEIGGIVYKAAPFNGWYMSTEIAARNLSDRNRYNQLPVIAEKLGLNTEKNRNLWKDHALLMLNEAVLHSFERSGVKIVDQHTASEQFMQFSKIEQEKGRNVTGDWSWLVPPLASAASPIFHKEWDNTVKGPNFYYQKNDWDEKEEKVAVCPFHVNSLK